MPGLPNIPGQYLPTAEEIEAIFASEPPPIRSGLKAEDYDPQPVCRHSQPPTDPQKRKWASRANMRRAEKANSSQIMQAR